MFSWNFRWGWVNLWGEVRAKFRGRRHTQKHFFSFRRQINHRAGTSHFRRLFFRWSIPVISNAFALCWEQIMWVLMILMGRIAMNCIRWHDIWFSNFAASSVIISQVQIYVYFLLLLSIIQLQHQHLCSQHASMSAEWVGLSNAAIQSLAIVDNLEASCERMHPLLTNAHDRLNWYVLHLHE